MTQCGWSSVCRGETKPIVIFTLAKMKLVSLIFNSEREHLIQYIQNWNVRWAGVTLRTGLQLVSLASFFARSPSCESARMYTVRLGFPKGGVGKWGGGGGVLGCNGSRGVVHYKYTAAAWGRVCLYVVPAHSMNWTKSLHRVFRVKLLSCCYF
jgi:hypothetical protein